MNALDPPLSAEAIQTAAQALATRRLTGRVGGALPDPCRPTTLSDALAVQEAVSAELALRAGERVVGWKCGLPGADTWVLAPLYASTLYRDDDSAGDGSDPPPAGWQVRKDGGEFDQFTGATVTPRAVVGAVRDALTYFERHRTELLAAPPAQA